MERNRCRGSRLVFEHLETQYSSKFSRHKYTGGICRFVSARVLRFNDKSFGSSLSPTLLTFFRCQESPLLCSLPPLSLPDGSVDVLRMSRVWVTASINHIDKCTLFVYILNACTCLPAWHSRVCCQTGQSTARCTTKRRVCGVPSLPWWAVLPGYWVSSV